MCAAEVRISMSVKQTGASWSASLSLNTGPENIRAVRERCRFLCLDVPMHRERGREKKTPENNRNPSRVGIRNLRVTRASFDTRHA